MNLQRPPRLRGDKALARRASQMARSTALSDSVHNSVIRRSYDPDIIPQIGRRKTHVRGRCHPLSRLAASTLFDYPATARSYCIRTWSKGIVQRPLTAYVCECCCGVKCFRMCCSNAFASSAPKVRKIRRGFSASELCRKPAVRVFEL